MTASVTKQMRVSRGGSAALGLMDRVLLAVSIAL
jgi:hypothetical protein